MDSNVLESLINNVPLLRVFFAGIITEKYDIDENTFAVVFVRSPVSNIGHYQVVCRYKRGEIIFFDSAASKMPLQLLKFAKQHQLRIKNYSRQLQKNNAQTCGLYCFVFVHKLYMQGELQIASEIYEIGKLPIEKRQEYIIHYVEKYARTNARNDLR